MNSELLILSAILFTTGVVGFLTRRNVFIVLMSLELILNSANIVFVVSSKQSGSPSGLASVLIVLVLAAAEAAVALSILVAIFRVTRTVNVDEWSSMRG